MNVELVSKTVPNKDYFHNKLQELIDNDIIDLVEANKVKRELDAEQLIIYIARVSSSRDNKLEDYSRLLNYLIDHKHWSPFEHAYMTVEIKTSRAITHQLIRHRSFTFQEFSQRYAEVTEFEDIELRKQPENNRQSSGEVFNPKIPARDSTHSNGKDVVSDFLQDSNLLYSRLLNAGVARETARFILPLCTKSTLYMTGNIRSWIHFLDIRDDSHAQKEIVQVAQEVGKIFQQEYPVISQALGFNYE